MESRTIYLNAITSNGCYEEKQIETVLSTKTIAEIREQILACEDFADYYNLNAYKKAWQDLIKVAETETNDMLALMRTNQIMGIARAAL